MFHRIRKITIDQMTPRQRMATCRQFIWVSIGLILSFPVLALSGKLLGVDKLIYLGAVGLNTGLLGFIFAGFYQPSAVDYRIDSWYRRNSSHQE